MLPLRDRIPTREPPVLNWALIVANVAVFFWQGAVEEAGYATFAADWGFVPARFLGDPIADAPTVLTSMFMHGGLVHLAGNMLFLWIFGDNVEDALGKARYAAFYVLGGLAAAAAQLAVDPASGVPMVGASGAISAVLAGYLTLHPRSPITVLNPVPFLWFVWGPFLEFPAWLVALEWFVANFLGGVGSLWAPRPGGGVAFFAHLGGFLAGLLLVRLALVGRQRPRADPWRGWRPPPSARSYRYK